MAAESSGDLPPATSPAKEGGDRIDETTSEWRVPQAGPVREEEVEHAVKFLSHPKVKGSPVVYRRSFLERKGLSREEIDEAFRRQPDPPVNMSSTTPPSEGSAGAANTAPQPKVWTGPAEPRVTGRPTSTSGSWGQMLVALGVLTAAGAGAGVLTRKYFIPRLRNWILDVTNTSTPREASNIAQTSAREETSSAMTAVTAVTAVSTLANQMAATIQEMANSKFAERQQWDRIIRAVEAQTQETKNAVAGMREIVLNAKEARVTRSATNNFQPNGGSSPDAWPGQTTTNGLRNPFLPMSGNQGIAKPSFWETASDPPVELSYNEQRGNPDSLASANSARRVPHSLSYLDPRSAATGNSSSEEPTRVQPEEKIPVE